MKAQIQYGKIEKYIAKTLNKYPNLRQVSKFFYQRLSYLIYHQGSFTYELHADVRLESILSNKNNFEVFFGYYDKSPWSYNGKYYLVHIFDKLYKNKVEIGVYDCGCKSLNIIDRTPAFNFQQGAMLRWLNKSSYNVIFNTVKNANLIAKIKNVISKKEIKTVSMLIQTINYEETEALVSHY